MRVSIARTLAGAGVALLLAAAPVALAGCGDPLSAEQSFDTAALEQDSGIAGTWQINLDLSDPPPGPLGDREGRNFGRNRPDGNRVGRPGAGRGEGPPLGPPGPRGERGGTLTIGLDEGAVTLSRGSGQIQTLSTDGQPSTQTLGRGEVEVEVTAEWQDGLLVIKRDTPRGVQTETFSVSDDGTRLYVDTRIEHDETDEPVGFTRVYDRVDQ